MNFICIVNSINRWYGLISFTKMITFAIARFFI